MVIAIDFAMDDGRWTDDGKSDPYSLLGRTKLDEVQGRIISRIYGRGRKPTTIALSFRKPGQESKHLFPRLGTKEVKRAKCRLIAQDKRDVSKEGKIRGNLLQESSKQHNVMESDADRIQKTTNATRPSDATVSLRTQPKITPEINEKQRDENEISLTPSCQRRFDRVSLRRGSVLSKNEFETSNIRITLSSCSVILGNGGTLQVPGRNGELLYAQVRKQLNSMESTSQLDCQLDSERGRVSPNAGSLLFPKPRLDSLLNTEGDVQKFRQLIRVDLEDEGGAIDEEERINYCDKQTTQRVELWLKGVRRARASEGLCLQTVDESIESERCLQQVEDDYDEERS